MQVSVVQFRPWAPPVLLNAPDRIPGRRHAKRRSFFKWRYPAQYGARRRATPLCRRALVHLRPERPALDDLDAGPPRIGDVGDVVAGGADARWLVELDAFGLDLLDEGGMVLHVEADVIEHAAAGLRLRGVGLGEADLRARNVDDRLVVAGAGLAAPGLGVPRLRLGDFGFRQGEVDVLMPDRHRLGLVFQDFDAHAVGRLDESLVEPVVAARQDRNAGGLPLGDLLLHG